MGGSSDSSLLRMRSERKDLRAVLRILGIDVEMLPRIRRLCDEGIDPFLKSNCHIASCA